MKHVFVRFEQATWRYRREVDKEVKCMDIHAPSLGNLAADRGVDASGS